ncbi:RNA-binding protein 44-like [Amphiprion ocellaris]|uniref:RNA-binding protein 44-like n=1 Tax=Amphiprion ocellaris TaxID=80972 RepID=UPI0024113FC3|nr:RNA-binding protein 44-like [Amphiprion ocellaris]
MVPCFLANPVWSSASASPWLGLWPHQVSVPGLPNSYREYPGAALTLPVVPYFYNPATELQNQQESRRFILHRSVFDLVEAHVYLSLTDSRLLNWYLSLSPEDRRIVQAEGGFRQFLQRHPALELTRRHVYVKYSTGGIRPVQPTVTSERSVKSGATTTRCEPPHTHLELEMFPRDLTLLGCRNTTGEHLCDEFCNSKQSLHLQESFHRTSSSPITERASLQKDLSSSAAVCSDPSVLAGLTLDLELDRCSQRPETRTHISADGDQNVTCSEARPSHSNWPTVNKEPSDFSSDRIRLDGSEYNDVNIVQTNSSAVGSESNTTEDRCQDDLLQRDQFTDEDQTENIQSIMEDDRSILVCCPSCLKSDHPQTTLNPSEFTCRPTWDVNVGTELLLRTSTFTQTEDPETVDKHVITEVHMSDLDYLAEEFTKLKTTQGQKEKIKREECDCTECAQKAELNLLTLQYNICRHHIWKIYWEGKQLSSVNKDPPENITEVLDKLDSDYQEMKREILAGVPLEQLKPLSVDSGMIISGGYTPAQMVADELGNVSFRTSEEPQQLYPAAERSRRPDDGSTNISQIKKKMIKTRRVASVILKDGRFLQTKQEGNQTGEKICSFIWRAEWMWNVTSLAGREPELVEVERYRLDVVGLTSTRSKGSRTRIL